MVLCRDSMKRLPYILTLKITKTNLQSNEEEARRAQYGNNIRDNTGEKDRIENCRVLGNERGIIAVRTKYRDS